MTLPVEYSPKKFAVIRRVGELNHATTIDGYKVRRTDKIFFPEHGLVRCAPYDTHFVYDNPSKKVGWSPMCTCGSPAGITGYNAYRKDGSPTTQHESTTPGELIVCLMHAQTGRHADGVQ